MFNLVQRLVKLFSVLRAVNKPFTVVFNKGFSVASTEIVHNLKKLYPDIRTIIDVGANKGQFALAISDKYPDADIYCFEPLPEVYLSLKSNCEDRVKCHTFNIALGSSDGYIDFYKTAYSLASSALKPSTFHATNTEYSTEISQIKVTVKRLDSFDSLISFNGPVLLKLDVQGFEKEVIKGSKGVIDKIDLILLEVSFTQMYENEPLFEEMHNFLTDLGFAIVAPLSAYQNSSLQVLQLDLLYKRIQAN